MKIKKKKGIKGRIRRWIHVSWNLKASLGYQPSAVGVL